MTKTPSREAWRRRIGGCLAHTAVAPVRPACPWLGAHGTSCYGRDLSASMSAPAKHAPALLHAAGVRIAARRRAGAASKRSGRTRENPLREPRARIPPASLLLLGSQTARPWSDHPGVARRSRASGRERDRKMPTTAPIASSRPIRAWIRASARIDSTCKVAWPPGASCWSAHRAVRARSARNQKKGRRKTCGPGETGCEQPGIAVRLRSRTTRRSARSAGSAS